MNDEDVTRRLAAIMAVDVVGYSRLMNLDEAATHAEVSACLETIVEKTIAQHKGRTVKFTGDGLLAEFPSAVEGVQCAVDIQHAMGERATKLFADVAQENRVMFRIGVNLGDIIIEDHDIFGDGVNVAARIEGLADPGGVFISSAVSEQISGKLDVALEDLGNHTLKHIAQPVHVFRVLFDGALPGSASGLQAEPTSPANRLANNSTWAVLAAVGLVVGGVAIWTQLGGQSTPPAPPPVQAEASKPTIAVLPFENLSNDQEQEYFSDGITGDLITDLSKVPGLMVIGRNSTFSYKGKPTEIRQVGRELGVRYVLEGSVRKVGGQVRINAQLIDAITGGHLWADRYDGDLKNVFALQDKISAEIVAAMTVALGTSVGTALVAGKPSSETAALTAKTRASGKTANAAAYDQYLQGWSFFHKRTPQDFVTAVTHFNRALELDPNYALAHAALASVYWESWKRFWQRHLGLSGNYPAWEQADKHLELAFKSPSPLTHRIKSEMLFINRRFDKAIAEAEISIALNPNDALGYVVLAEAKTFAGLASEAVPLMDKAFLLDPHTPPSSLYTMGLVQFGLGNYEKAKGFLERAIKKNHQDPLWYVLLIATYGHLNEPEKATAANARLVKLQKAAGLQRFSIYWPHGRWPFKDKKDKERLKQGMLAGGLPEY